MKRKTHVDPTELGVLTEVILLLSLPMYRGSGAEYTNRLLDKTQAWLGVHGSHETIQGKALRHRGRSATARLPN